MVSAVDLFLRASFLGLLFAGVMYKSLGTCDRIAGNDTEFWSMVLNV
jgi:hypothetical protein